eukprot:Nk52_evm1s1187 gene=Nk52_evmTU1s1187
MSGLSIPEVMKAAVMEDYGPPSVLKVREDIPVPKGLGEYELLVKNEASSVNPGECMLREGRIKLVWSLKFPSLMGFDFSGEVVAKGSKVGDDQFVIGDKVFGKLTTLAADKGAHAEYVKADVKKDSIAKRPENISALEAAALPTISTTALQGIEAAGLQKGSKVVINGGSGGIGTLSIQMAKAKGAYVTAVCSTKNVDLVKSLGADDVVDYTKKSYADQLAGQDYDCVIDIVGGPTQYEDADRVLKPKGGIFVMICGDYPDHGPIGVKDMVKNMGRLFVRKTTRLVTGKANPVMIVDMDNSSLDPIAELIKAGKIKPVIVEKPYSLKEIGQAHTLSESKRARGKLVVDISS